MRQKVYRVRSCTGHSANGDPRWRITGKPDRPNDPRSPLEALETDRRGTAWADGNLLNSRHQSKLRVPCDDSPLSRADWKYDLPLDVSQIDCRFRSVHNNLDSADGPPGRIFNEDSQRAELLLCRERNRGKDSPYNPSKCPGRQTQIRAHSALPPLYRVLCSATAAWVLAPLRCAMSA